MKSGLLLDVVVSKSATILELLASKNQPLLIGRDTFLVLNFLLDLLNGITSFDLEGDGLSCESFDKNLHASAETKNQMKSGLLLNVVIGEGAAIFQLLARKDEALLVRRNTFLVLDLLLDLLNGITSFDLQGNGLAGQRFYEDLHATTEAEDQVESGLLLDVVVSKSATILELLARKDKTLLIGRNTFLVLNLLLDLLNGVRAFDLEGDGLASESLDEDLHVAACVGMKSSALVAFLLS